jgi:hypothetical protein
VCGAGEVFAGHFGEDAGAGPDADAGHRGQDLVKRVGLHEGFNLGGDVVTLAAQGQQLFCQFRENDPGGTGAHNHDGLFPECTEDRVGESFCGAGCVFLQPGFDVSAAGGLQGAWCRISCQQVGYGRVVEVRAQGTLEGWMNLGEQPADPVGRGR